MDAEPAEEPELVVETDAIIPAPKPIPEWTQVDLKDLQVAKNLLENPGLAVRLTEVIGGPVEKGFSLLPTNWRDTLQTASRKSLMAALEIASNTMTEGRSGQTSDLAHKIAVGASGGIGGMFGLPAMTWELPLSTTIMLRSILDIARCEGHSPRELETRLSCLEVFALGGTSPDDDAADGGYWTVRSGLAAAMTDAAAFIAKNGFTTEGAPALAKLVASISTRFGVVVSEQVAAKAVPVLGAAAGSAINVLFMNHFQDMARGHFIVKRMELKYSIDGVKDAYANRTF
ncbi:MAG: EcsC family protein [Limisphaerales bacterium]